MPITKSLKCLSIVYVLVCESTQIDIDFERDQINSVEF